MMVELPNYLRRTSWKKGNRVKVATGEFKGKRGTVVGYAMKHNYLVLLDNEDLPRQFNKGNLDPA